MIAAQNYYWLMSPPANLNSKQGEEIMELFKDLNKEGVTIYR